MKKFKKYNNPQKSISSEHLIPNTILTIIFFTGLLLTIWEIDIYQKTVIDWKIPTSIWILTGFLALPYTKRYLANYYDTTGLFLQLVFNIAGIGGIIVFLFMGINKYCLTNEDEVVINTNILKIGKLQKGKNGCTNPYAEVKINDFDKQLIFPCGMDISGYKSVELKLKKGLLRFDIITSQKLIN